MDTERRPWERLDEGAWACEIFRTYRDLDPTRTVRAVGTPVGRRVLGHIERWASRLRWRVRAAAWDTEVYRRHDDALLAAIHPPQPASHADLEPEPHPLAALLRLVDGS